MNSTTRQNSPIDGPIVPFDLFRSVALVLKAIIFQPLCRVMLFLMVSCGGTMGILHGIIALVMC